MNINFTLEEIQNVAKQILETPLLKKVITFHAEMGAGKTTFIKEVAKEVFKYSTAFLKKNLNKNMKVEGLVILIYIYKTGVSIAHFSALCI